MSATRLTAVLHLALSVVLAGSAAIADDRPASAPPQPQAARVDLKPAFEENRGQTDPRVRFVSKSARQTLFLTPDEAVLALRSGSAPATLRLRLQGASDRAELRGLDPLTSTTYYATPQTRGRLEAVHSYRRVRYTDVYPGIDLEYYRTEQHLEFDFALAPHADPTQIVFAISGAESIAREPNGELALKIGSENVVLKRPVAFQIEDGVRREVTAAYAIAGNTVRFEVGAYDASLPLVIDPMIVYATYLGGVGDDFVIGADVSDGGDLYLFGRTTNGLSFPHTYTEPAQHTIDPINCFVSKLTPDGTTLDYSVIFEGFGICEAFELDGDRVHVAMQSQLGNFNGFAQLRTIAFEPGTGVTVSPLKGGTFGQIPGGPTQIEDIRSDDFGNTYVLFHQLAGGELQSRLLKLDATGGLVDIFDVGVTPDSSPSARALAVDNFGQVFIVGSTTRDIAPSPDAFQPTKPSLSSCPENGFLIRVNTNTSPFEQTYATYLAGNGCDSVLGVVRDPLGLIYLTGRSTSEDFPIGAPAAGGPGGDAFIIKFDLSQPPQSQLLEGQFLGLQLGTGSQGVDDVFHPLIRLPNGLLALTGGARGADFFLHNHLFDATGAAGFPRFLQVFSQPPLDTVVSTHLDATGLSTYAVAAGPKRSRLSSPQNYLFVVTNTPEGGLATPGRLQDQPAGGEDLLIRKIDHADVANIAGPFVDLGPDITIEAADQDGADFDLSCVGCSIVDLGGALNAYHWYVDGVPHVLTGPPFVGEVTLPVGVHKLELVVTSASGGIGNDSFVVTVQEPTNNRPPSITIGADQTVVATSPDGLLHYLIGAVSDPDSDTLDVTWVVAGTTIQFEVFPPYFSGNASMLTRLPIGVDVATLRVSDEHGHIETAQYTITVLGANTSPGANVEVRPVDDTFQYTFAFTPGKIKVTFDGVATEGLTYFRTRTNQVPPPPGAPEPKQLGSSPFYYDVTTTATTSGDIRVCIDTTGMSFVERTAIRLYRLNGATWEDVTAPSQPEETAANFLCGITQSSGAIVGTFAIFTPASEGARVTTIAGNGGPYVPGNPAPGDGGPATQAAITFPQSFVMDMPRQAAYVGDSTRVRRIDLTTNTITTFAGNGEFGIAEPDGALATEINVSAGGIAVDRNGNVFLSGINGCSILRVDVNTRRVRRVAGLGPNPTTLECHYAGDGGPALQADINGSGRIAFDAEGNLFFTQTVFSTVSAGPGKAIRRIAAGADHLITGDDAGEIITTVAGGGTQWPPQDGNPREALIDANDIAFNQQGDLYIGGTAFVVRITPAPGAPVIDGRSGEALSVVVGEPILRYAPYQGDGGPALEANLDGPWGIDILPNGDLLIADTGSSRIRLVTAGSDHVVNGGADETITTVAGFTDSSADVNAVPFNGDGYALSTSFSSPRDVVVDPRGGYNIVDTGFNRIRHVGPLTPVEVRADIAVSVQPNTDDTSTNTPVTYRVVITNHGPSTATNAGVGMPVPGNARVVTANSPVGFCIIPAPGVIGGNVFCEARTMAPGSSVVMTIVVNPISGGDLTTTFTGGATEQDPVPDNNSVTTSIRVVEPIDLAVAVTSSAAQVHALQPFSYTVTISNLTATGARIARMNAALASGLRFDSATPAGICDPLGNLITCDVEPFAGNATLDIIINVTPIGLGVATSTFTVSNPDGDPNPANDTRSIDVNIDGIVIAETVHVSDAAAAMGAAMIPVVNEAIHVSDGPPTTMAAAMIPISETIRVSDGPPTATGAVMLPVNETIRVTDTPTLPGVNVTVAKHILDERGLGYPALTVDADSAVSFRLRVTNTSAIPTTAPTAVTDVLDSRLTFIMDASDQRCANVGQTITCTAAGPIAPGAAVDFLLLVRVARDAAAPRQTVDIVNQATVTTAADENPADNSSSATLTVRGLLPPNVFVTKEALNTGTAWANGSTHTIRFTVTNRWSVSGNRFEPPDFGATFGPVSVTDVLDPRLTFVQAGSDSRCAALGQTVGCIANDVLQAGQSIVFDVTVRVNANAAPPAGETSIPNTATVSTPGDSDTSDNTSTIAIPVRGGNRPDIDVVKTVRLTSPIGSPAVGSLTVSNGTAVTFQMNVHFQASLGGGPLAGPVTLTDTLPAGLVPTAARGVSRSASDIPFTCAIAGQQVTCTLTQFQAVTRSDALVEIDAQAGSAVAEVDQRVTLVNTATVATTGEDHLSDNTSSATVVVAGPRAPDVEIRKTIVDTTRSCGSSCGDIITSNGGEVTFLLTVPTNSNHLRYGDLLGPVTITDTLPAGLAPISARDIGASRNDAPTDCAISGQQVTCRLTLFEIAPNTIVVQVVARVGDNVAGINQTVTLQNIATVATIHDAVASNNTSLPVTISVQGPPAGAVTGIGGNVIVRPTDANNSPQPITVRFTGVTQNGYTTAIPVVPPPAAPPRFQFRGVVYDISTTATVSGPIEVCFDGGPFLVTDLVWHAGIVLPIGAHPVRTPARICALVTSLSPFGVVTPTNQAPTANAGVYPPVEATSPNGAAITLVGSGTDPDGDALTFAWSEGTTPLGNGATALVNLSLGVHDITLTVTDAFGATATSTTRVVVRDTRAPVIVAPAPITVPATEASGARGAASAALSAFLAAGSASDIVDLTPVRLPGQVGSAAVTGTTLFPIGKTTVKFSYRDASGNVGSATSTVTVVLGTPKVAINIVGVGVVSGNRKFVDLHIANTGNGNARQLAIDLVALIPIKGLGIPKLVTPIPVAVGSVDAGASTTVRITFDVPKAVKRISISEIGTFRNVKGQLGAYLETQEFLVP